MMFSSKRVVTVGVLALVASALGCSSRSRAEGSSGSAGTGGSSGSAGAGGTAGSAGTGGTAGSAGSAGSAGGAGSGGTASCTHDSTWELVDDYLRAPGEQSNISGIAVDSKGNVYAAGLARAGTFGGIVRKSTDGGRAWVNVAWGDGLPNDVAADDAGNVYVVAGLNGARVVRRSADTGNSWQDVTNIPPGSGPPTDPCNTGFVATGPRGVVVAGASCDSTGWVVRKSSDSGASWQDSFTYRMAAGKTARMSDVGVDAEGTVYATGNATDSSDSTHWVTVREGAPTGIVADDFQLVSGSLANGGHFSSRGMLMVAGFASDGQTTQGIVRAMTFPTMWATLDRFPGRAVGAEPAGNKLISVGTLENGSASSAVTRLSSDDGRTWTQLDQYTYGAAGRAASGALAADATGNVYAAVVGTENNVNHWLVRRLACR